MEVAGGVAQESEGYKCKVEDLERSVVFNKHRRKQCQNWCVIFKRRKQFDISTLLKLQKNKMISINQLKLKDA